MGAASEGQRTVAGRRAHVYVISAIAALSGLLFGFDTAVINGALPFLRQDFRLTDFQVEIAAGVLLWGCVFGALGAGALSDRLGRRGALRCSAVLFALAAVGSAIPPGLMGLAAARFAAGLAIGVASALAPMYIAEIAPARVRGRLVSMNQLAIVTGILLAYFVNWRLAVLGAGSWRWMFAAAAAPAVAFYLGLLRIPESPRWLMRRGDERAAFDILARIAPADEARAEVAAIRRAIEEEAASKVADLFRPGLRKPFVVAVSLAVLQQVTGINTILYYGSILLKEHAGQETSAAIGANVLVGLVNLVCTIAAMFVIDRVGRRPLLMAGAAGMGLSLAGLGLAFRRDPLPVNLLLALILAYVACFATSMGPGVWVYISELFPTAIRGRAVSAATVCLWAACLLVTLTFLTLVQWLTPAGAFWIYAGLCAATVAFVWRAAPETSGKSLEEIQRLWTRDQPSCKS